VQFCPTATVAERQRFLEPHMGTQLSEGVGTTMRVTNLPGLHFKSICRRAELPTIGLHDFRHTCATILVVARKHPNFVQELLKPRSTKTSRSTRTRA